MTERSVGECWLCDKEARLTREHIPARRAFNDSDRPFVLQRVSNEARRNGVLAWEDEALYTDGFSRVSLCETCNQRSGRKFVNSYAELTDAVAQLGRRVSCGHRFNIPQVRNAALVLRQVLHQFVTANGRSFVLANPWIRDFIMDIRQKSLPENVYVYLYAMKEQTMRITGVGGTIFLPENRFAVLAEFSRWPLGTVLSFHRLDDQHLTPISDWAGVDRRQTVDVSLCMSHAIAPSFIDFRDSASIQLAAFKTQPLSTVPPESLVKEMVQQCSLYSGTEDANEFTHVAHPSLRNASS